MIFLTPRFTLLAVSCTLAVISLSPLSASAVAIEARGSASSSKSTVTRTSGQEHSYHNQAYFGDRPMSEERDSHLPVSRHHNRRSSLIVAGQHGESYIVSESSHASRSVHKRFDSTDDQAYFESEADQVEEVPGRVDVMSPTANAQESKKIGSLWVDPVTLIFGSDENNATEISLATVPGAINMTSNSNMRVVIMKVRMFNASSTLLQSYCATTHTQGGSSDMTAERCNPETITPSHNQLFTYNVDSGVINPTQIEGQDDGKKDDLSSSSSNSTEPDVASVFGKRDVEDPGNAQNVELMFVSKAPKVANVDDTPESPPATVVTATTTMTSTFTYTTSMTASVSAANVVPTSAVTLSDSAVTSSLVSTSSVPVSAANASPTSATVSSSSSPIVASNSAMSAAAIGSTSSVDASSSSIMTTTDILSASSSSATSSASSVPSLDALNVQVVAPLSSSITSTTVTWTSAAPTSSINADALASSIAASFASNRAASASSATTAVTSTVAATATAMDAGSSVASSSVSSSMPSMTPVSTDPYALMFKVGIE